MQPSELIDDILRLTPSASANQARARFALARMSTDDLLKMRDDLTGLRRAGAEALAALPGGKSQFKALIAQGARHLETASTRLAALQAKIDQRAAGAVTGSVGLGSGRHPEVQVGVARLDQQQTIEALARIENVLIAQRPDRLVAVNDEGWAIAQFMNHNLGLGIPISRLIGSAADGLMWADVAAGGFDAGLVAVIGHVAWTGQTLREAVEWSQGRFHPRGIFTAVLATSRLALDCMKGVAPFAYHQVTLGEHLALEINPADLRIGDGVYEFRAADPATGPFTITPLEMERTRLQMRNTFGADI